MVRRGGFCGAGDSGQEDMPELQGRQRRRSWDQDLRPAGEYGIQQAGARGFGQAKQGREDKSERLRRFDL